MGMDRAKSLLCVRRGLSFLDIIARQVLHLRKEYDAPLPLLFMNSFRTSADTMAALARYEDLPGRGPAAGVPAEQGAQAPGQGPRAGRAGRGTPTSSGARPATATSTPRCAAPASSSGSSRPATSGSSSPTPTTSAPYPTPGSRAGSPPAARRSRSRRSAVRRRDRKGGHFARRKSDGRIVLRETAQTLPKDQDALADLDRHRFCSTNNLWFDLRAMKEALDVRDGILGPAADPQREDRRPERPDHARR